MRRSTTTRVAYLAALATAATMTLAACDNGGGGTTGGGGGSPRAGCEKLNDTQRAATKLGDDLSSATSNDNNDQLTNDANAVNQDLSSALASGDFIGTPIQNDLQSALKAIHQIEDDLQKPDIAQANLDEGALRNAMSQLGADCSPYLS